MNLSDKAIDRINTEWIKDSKVLEAFIRHFCETGEMDDTEIILSFKYCKIIKGNSSLSGFYLIEVDTSGWVLEAVVDIDSEGNFIRIIM